MGHVKIFKAICVSASFGAMIAVSGCGVDRLEKLKKRDMDHALAKPAVVLDVQSSLKPALHTNSIKHSLTTSLVLKPASYPLPSDTMSRFVTTITVTGPSGAKIPVLNAALKPIADGSQSGTKAEWEIRLAESHGMADGDYTIEVVSTSPSEANLLGVDLPEPWSAKIRLDNTQPIIGLHTEIVRRFPEGMRYLTAYGWAANEKEAICAKGELRTADPNKMVPVDFLPANDSSFLEKLKLESDTPLVVAANVALPMELREPFTLYLSCSDAAGNKSEFIQPVGVTTPPLGFSAKLDGVEAKIAGTDRSAFYVKPGMVKALFGLSDLVSGQALSRDYVSTIASTLRVIVTEKSPIDLEDILNTKSVLWSQPFADSMSFPLPPSYDGEATIFATLLMQDLTKNKERLIRTVPIRLYTATKPASVSWVSQAQFVPFAPNVPITGKFRVATTQAPLVERDPLSLEYSTTVDSWLPLPAELEQDMTTATQAGPATFTYSFVYPLPKEQPFRIRVKAKDIAGHVATSTMSPNLVGQASLALAVSKAERDACTSSGASGSKFKPWLASGVLCQIADLAGQKSGAYHAQILLQNRGGASMQLYSTSFIAPGMGYRVLVDGVQVAQNRFIGGVVDGVAQPPAMFGLAPDGSVKLLNFSLQDQWLLGNKVVIEFDREDTGANSIANSCYAQGQDYPSVVVQDKSIDLTPVRGPMACD